METCVYYRAPVETCVYYVATVVLWMGLFGAVDLGIGWLAGCLGIYAAALVGLYLAYLWRTR